MRSCTWSTCSRRNTGAISTSCGRCEMRRAVVAAFSLAVVVAGAVLAPTAAVANGRHGGRAAHHGQHGSSASHHLHTVAPQRFFPPRFFHGTRTVIIGTPLIGYG